MQEANAEMLAKKVCAKYSCVRLVLSHGSREVVESLLCALPTQHHATTKKQSRSQIRTPDNDHPWTMLERAYKACVKWLLARAPKKPKVRNLRSRPSRLLSRCD